MRFVLLALTLVLTGAMAGEKVPELNARAATVPSVDVSNSGPEDAAPSAISPDLKEDKAENEDKEEDSATTIQPEVTTTKDENGEEKKKVKSVRKGDLREEGEDQIGDPPFTTVAPNKSLGDIVPTPGEDDGVKSVKKGDLGDEPKEEEEKTGTTLKPTVGKKDLDAPPPIGGSEEDKNSDQGRKKDLGAPPTEPPTAAPDSQKAAPTARPRNLKVSVEEPVPVSVTEPHDHSEEVSDPTTPETSLVVGIVFALLLFSVVGFLAFKRVKAVRRRREYRKMNDFLIDGMYNDL